MMPATSAQPDLFAARGNASKRPSGAAQLVPQLRSALRGRGWVAGAALAAELGTDLRGLRDAAHESGGYVLGGNKGYCLTLEATLIDVQAVVRRFFSQSQQMRSRAMEIERVRHGSVQNFVGAARSTTETR